MKILMALHSRSTLKKSFNCNFLLSIFFFVLKFFGSSRFEFVFPPPFSLATEQELLAAQTKAEEFEKENCDLVNMLTLKEQELDLRLQEKVFR